MTSYTWSTLGRTFAAGAIGASLSAGAAIAQDYPTKPVTLVVGFTPGGSTDLVARILAEHMSDTLGQPVVVENRPGAAGTVGIAHVANSDPDGYTLGVSGLGASILLEALGRETGYDVDSQLDVIGVIGTMGLLIAGREGLEPTTLPELLTFASENPEELTYGTAGVGTPGHLAMEYLIDLAGATMLHIPYTGSMSPVNDMMGGHLDVAILPTAGIMGHVRSGAMVPFAVTSAERSDLMPDVPTVGESGSDGFTATLWNLLVTPQGTPEDIQSELSEALNAAMQDEGVISAFAEQGLAPTVMSPAEATQFLADERAKWVGIIADLDIEAPVE